MLRLQLWGRITESNQVVPLVGVSLSGSPASVQKRRQIQTEAPAPGSQVIGQRSPMIFTCEHSCLAYEYLCLATAPTVQLPYWSALFDNLPLYGALRH